MCGVIPMATSLESSSSKWPECEFCSAAFFPKPGAAELPESPEAAPLAGASQPWSHPVPQEQEGLGEPSPPLEQGCHGDAPSWLGCPEPCPESQSPGCAALARGVLLPRSCSWGRGPGPGAEAQGCEVHAECVISSLQCPHCWIRGLENTT